jgi:2-desacetyl-2-hydroxyethyl bacteriochlorophyllide A dehydrogenase
MGEPITARQFWIAAPGRGALVDARLPPRRDGEVSIRTLYSGISRGTEALVFRGGVPPSQYQAMRAPFQEGELPGPVKYGYSSVGRVVEGADDLDGQVVFCLYPHQDRYMVPRSAVTRLPAGVPPGRAVLAANMETAVNVLWDARPVVGDRVVVVGGGVVGLLCARLCRAVPGVALTLVDPNPARSGAVVRNGISSASATAPRADADLVIHASGHPDGLAAALAVAGVEGTIVEASWYGDRPVPLPLGEAFHARRLTVRSSQVGRLPPARTPRWDHARRMALAMTLLGDARLDALITGEDRFEELPAVMARVSKAPGDTLCHRIRY